PASIAAVLSKQFEMSCASSSNCGRVAIASTLTTERRYRAGESSTASFVVSRSVMAIAGKAAPAGIIPA
ncbi:MAG: hypothetical protein QXU75_03395, partial [Candidatus Methanomethylicaceae archaeon]